VTEYHSIESEQMLLGAVLTNNAAFALVDEIVQ
jgi:replicative DNA helicase